MSRAGNRAVGWLGMLVMLGLLSSLPCSCKKKPQEDSGRSTQKVASESQDKQTHVDPPVEGTADAKSQPLAENSEVAEESGAEKSDVTTSPEVELQLPENVDPKTHLLKSPRVFGVDATVDKTRLKSIFVEMWCSKFGGASEEELFQIYTKYGYPDVDVWMMVWTRALEDGEWAVELLEAARQKCPEATAAGEAELSRGLEQVLVPPSPEAGAPPTALVPRTDGAVSPPVKEVPPGEPTPAVPESQP